MRKEKPWTRRSTIAWLGHFCTWWRRDWTFSSWSVYVRAFSLRCARLIVKPSSGSWGTFVSHLSLVFGFWPPPLFLFAGILIRIMLAILLRESPRQGLLNLLDLLLCLGPLEAV
jgi:hypothetical protein